MSSIEDLDNAIDNAKGFRTKYIAVTINSGGGPLHVADYFVHRLRTWAEEEEANLETFVEDHCLGTANAILFAGKKCFASKPRSSDKFSVVGDFGSFTRQIDLRKSMDKFDVGVTILRKGEDKAKPNPFEELAPKDKEFLIQHSKMTAEELHSMLYKLKEKQLKHKGISFEDFRKTHLSKPIADLNDLVSIGCLDGFDYLDDRLQVNADGNPQHQILVPNKGDNSAAMFRRELGVEAILNQRFRPL